MGNIIIKNAKLFDTDEIVNIKAADGKITQIQKEGFADLPGYKTADAGGSYIAPGFIDLHVHLRDPGFTHKEDIDSGAKAAIKGGITALCCMPNTDPCADCPEVIKYILEKNADCKIFPVGAITKSQKGEVLTDFAELKRAGAAALSDDGRPVENEKFMREAMIRAEKNDMLIMSHCEDLKLSGNKAEYTITKRDTELAGQTGAKLHICHASTKKSAEYIAKAKDRGFFVTAETCPHYFAMTENDVSKYGVNAKMNPPLRSRGDKEKIIEAIKYGGIDCISTDHAPHSEEEKRAGANGITGLETMFALSVTYLVKQNHITLKKLIELIAVNPAKIIGAAKERGSIETGKTADFVIFSIDEKFVFDKNKSCSKSKNTPFHGFELYGKILQTIVKGDIKYVV